MAIYDTVMNQVFSQMSSITSRPAPIAVNTMRDLQEDASVKQEQENIDTTLNRIGLAINREGGMSI